MSWQKKFNLSSTVLLIIAIVLALNWLSAKFFWHRFDLTATQRYSLSPASQQAAKAMPDMINVTAYFSNDLPTQYAQWRQDALDLLNEYHAYAPNIRVKVAAPTDDSQMQQLGIPKLQFNDINQDKMQVVSGYLGIVLAYGDKNEVIPVAEDDGTLEYQITRSLDRLAAPKQIEIGWLSSNGAPADQTAQQILQQLYAVVPVDLSKTKTIDQGVKTLIIAGPTVPFNKNQLATLDNFLAGGHSIMVFAGGLKVAGNLTVTDSGNNLNDWLKKYGLKIENNLVLDQSSAVATFNQGFMNVSVNYPAWVKLLKQNFSANDVAVSSLDGVVLPWPSPVDQFNGTNTPTTDVLARSSDFAWLVDKTADLAPGKLVPPQKTEQYNLAVELSGVADNKDSRLIVIGNDAFISDNFLQQQPANQTMLQNLTDSLSLNNNLAAIRAKAQTDAGLKEIDESTKLWLKLINIFGGVALLAAFGIVRYIVRKKTKFLTI